MTELIIYYILIWVIVCNLLSIWMDSALPLHLFARFFVPKDEVNTCSFKDLISGIDSKSPFFGDLLSCSLCLGTWNALIVATIMKLHIDLSWFFVLACTFSIPYLVKKTLRE